MKERWRLIQSGIPRSEIKIQDSCLNVKKKLFGYFDKSEFQYCSSPLQSSPTSTDHLQSDVQTLRENTPLSLSALPFVPDSSTIVSQSPSATALSTDPTSSFAKSNLLNTSAQSPSPSPSLPLPAADRWSSHCC